MTTIKLKRGTSASWSARNPILSAGEPGVELDTDRLKIGDGTTPWNNLPYIGSGGVVDPNSGNAMVDHVNSLLPHPVYDDGPSLFLLYENAKV